MLNTSFCRQYPLFYFIWSLSSLLQGQEKRLLNRCCGNLHRSHGHSSTGRTSRALNFVGCCRPATRARKAAASAAAPEPPSASAPRPLRASQAPSPRLANENALMEDGGEGRQGEEIPQSLGVGLFADLSSGCVPSQQTQAGKMLPVIKMCH